LVYNFIAPADETFFMAFTHVRVQFVVVKEAVSAELAQWMDTTFDLVLRDGRAVLPLHGRKMGL
jgi:hypothetical protein